jgi:hypothetical protein
VSDRRRFAALLLLLPGLGLSGPVRDPMRPPEPSAPAVTAATPAVALVLNSTLIARDRRLATINGQRYRLGDRVAGATLIEIVPTAVVLERGGRRQRLELLPSRVRSAADR